MIWRRVTAAAVGLCLALGVWIYVRDLNASPPRVSGHDHAVLDAEQVLGTAASARTCGVNRCEVHVLGRVVGAVWRVDLSAPSWHRCFLVNVDTFDYSKHGIAGLRSVPCLRS